MNSKLQVFLLVLLGVLFVSCESKIKNSISLDGQWTVKLDSLNLGEKENWAVSRFEGTAIALPGTLDDAEIGTPNSLKPELNNYVLSNLARKHQYIGKAWYQKEVEIPSNWEGKHIGLTLERVIWESTVFVDGKEIGKAESLIGDHRYNLTEALSPGKHLLTIRIDNGNKYPLINVAGSKYPDPINQDMAHGYTNHTQIKWNGILGDIVLKAKAKNTPKNLQIYPELKSNTLRITYEQLGTTENSSRLELLNNKGEQVYKAPIENTEKKGNTVSFQINRPEGLEFWDEFEPNVYQSLLITGTDTLKTTFGYKAVAQDKGNLTLNGNRIFLRGNLECSIFPLTGHPPMQKEGWEQLIQQAKAYGLNHLRFHSWCPPRAAFEAADEAGFYLQVELAHWSLRVGEDAKTTEFLRQEADKLLRDYGNHPSFILFALGNELQGDIGLLNEMTAELKKKDNRHLYATTAFSFQKPTGERPEQEDEYFIAQWTDKGWIRGQGIFNDVPPHFNADYSENSEHIEIPLISHEIGQYTVYPDLSEIPKYTGVLDPLNFKAVELDLKQKGLIRMAKDFTQASGKLAAMLYKEEIERALKTSSFDGFQLLQLQDFPGQGTALVGLLNAFWESKGIISAEEFSEFNNAVTPLIRFEKAVYENGEPFTATVEVANFYKELIGQELEFQIKDAVGQVVHSETFTTDISIGNNKNLGSINKVLEVESATEYTLELALKGTSFKNHWNIWVYPNPNQLEDKKILFTRSFKEAITLLEAGKTVLLNPDIDDMNGVIGRFVPVFWSPVHFPDQPGTMGLLIDHTNPAMSEFPTASYTDWQWWDLTKQSKAITLPSSALNPIVRVIDNFVTNRNLATVFEAKVGEGKLLFCSMDIYSNLNKRPVARQLRYSFSNYINNESFHPTVVISAEKLLSIQSK
jgi:hypothetical protein